MEAVREDVMEIEKLAEGGRAALYSALTTLLLAGFKTVIGLLSGSIALTADALHSLTDVVGTLTVWFGFKLSQRKPDKTFSYGYYKAESFAAFIVSIIVIMAGLGLLRESYSHLNSGREISFIHFALAVSMISAIVDYKLYLYKKKVGGKINSHALLADSKNSKSDVATSIVVFIGILSSGMGLQYVEPFVGFIISLLIIRDGLFILKGSVLILMDACIDPELGDKIRAFVKEVDGVTDVKEVRLRRSGPFVFGEATVEMSGSTSVAKSHEQADKIESKIRKNLSQVGLFTIHVEPSKSNKDRIALPISENNGLQSMMAVNFGKAPFFMFIDVDGTEILNSEVKKNPAAKLEQKIGMTVAKFLVENKVTAIISPNVGEGAYYALKDHLVKILKLEGSTIGGVIEKFNSGKLQDLEAG